MTFIAGRWDDALLALFGVPRSVLPEVWTSAALGMTEPELFGGAIPICGVAGDQQAALVGQACFAPGMIKATYGTGSFVLLNTGRVPVASNNRLVTTVAYQLGGARSYALEGSIFVAGAAVQWLRDGLKVIKSAEESGALAQEADPSQDVSGSGLCRTGRAALAARCRGALFGLRARPDRANWRKLRSRACVFRPSISLPR